MALGVGEGEAGVDAMRAAGELAEAGGRLLDQLGLGQDAAADGDHRVGGEDERAGQLRIVLGEIHRRGELLLRQAAGEIARQLVLLRRLVDRRRHDAVGLNADLAEQCEAAGRA